MKKSFVRYYVYLILNILLIKLFLGYIVTSFIDGNIWGVVIGSWVVASDLSGCIVRHQNFIKYYPFFNKNWLYFVI